MSEWRTVTRPLYTAQMLAAVNRGEITLAELDKALAEFKDKTGLAGGAGEMKIKFRVIKRKDKEHGGR